MKLRNRKTGMIGELHYNPEKEYCFTIATEDPADMMIYMTIGGIWYDWEDYTPAEPLIKDEKIREIVRPWAKVNGVVGLTYDAAENSLTDIFRNEISFNGSLGLEDGCFYTTNELCGEEEE